MTDEPVVVFMARMSYAGPGTDDGRFLVGVVQQGQLLLAGDPVVLGGPGQWVPVGVADAVTAKLITDMGQMATFDRLSNRLGPPQSQTSAPVRVTSRSKNRPRRGRPKGTRSVPKSQIVEKFRSLRKNYGRNPTERELADNLRPRIEVRTLQEHLTDYDLSWPIE